MGTGPPVNRIIPGMLVGLVAGMAVTWAVLGRHEHADEEAKPRAAEASHAVHAGGRTVVSLGVEDQQRAGLKAAPLAAAALAPEVKAYGRVLDPAPLSQQILEIATARAALDASTKEFDRVKVLHAPDQTVSTRTLESAEAAMRHDQIALDAAQLKFVATWSKAIASRPDLPALARSLASLETAIVRVDVPLGTKLEAAPTAARIAALGAPDRPVGAHLLGRAADADPRTQGQGFLLLLDENSLPAGTAVVAWLGLPGEPEQGVIVPRSAVVRHEGETFVYVQTGEETFERQGVRLERPTETGWFVGAGLRTAQNTVVVGAQELLSEELKGLGGEEE